MEDRINDWLKEVQPIIEQVTHVVHANTHWITVWYLGEKEKK